MQTSIALVSAMAIVGSAQAGAQEPAEPAKQSVVTLKVSGMQCHLCAGTVERTAKELAGVIAATANQPKGTAEVTYDPAKTSPEDIARFLTRKSGFETELQQQR